MKHFAVFVLSLFWAFSALAQYTRQDTLRGSNGRGRDWWDVLRYDLLVTFDTASQSIKGKNLISFRSTTQDIDSMQIDLQAGMNVTKVSWDGRSSSFQRDGNVIWIKPPLFREGQRYPLGEYRVQIEFEGKPHVAANPPWDGGFVWSRDSTGRSWIGVACQFQGASCWWPCKDYQGDEPDNGMSIRIDGDYSGAAIANGRFTLYVDTISQENPVTGASRAVTGSEGCWSITNPINTYNATFYIGDYAHWQDTFLGEKGILDLDFYPLKYREAVARQHWAQAKEMLRCFEHWFGPYPFYEDGYKLVEAPYLGMEHQSAIAYGNEYLMGYRGFDVSQTGVGLTFDYIIIHESAHEWFGNSITARDPAENWLHESFATYAEALFAEWAGSRDAAFRYTRGQWPMIRRDGRHVIGSYGVNYKSNSDIYCKGSAILHMIRMMLHDDKRFRQLLRGLNGEFYHKIVSSEDVEAYISKFAGMDLKPFFNQYLRQPGMPAVVAYPSGQRVKLEMRNFLEGFRLPIYDQQGKFVCELSDKQVTISKNDLPALRNYLLTYVPTKEELILPPN